MQPHRGTTILILGIASIICNICLIPSILSIMWGGQDLQAMNAGTMDPSGRDTTNIGRILGMVGIALWLIAVIANVVLGGLGAMMGAMGGG